MDVLDKLCCDGLRRELRSRIAKRPRGVEFEWSVHGYPTRPKVLSNRAVVLPLPTPPGVDPRKAPKSAFRQAIVRINSEQSISKHFEDGRIEQGQVKPKSELFVLQKRMIRGKEENWMVWGTTKENSVEDLEDWGTVMPQPRTNPT